MFVARGASGAPPHLIAGTGPVMVLSCPARGDRQAQGSPITHSCGGCLGMFSEERCEKEGRLIDVQR